MRYCLRRIRELGKRIAQLKSMFDIFKADGIIILAVQTVIYLNTIPSGQISGIPRPAR